MGTMHEHKRREMEVALEVSSSKRLCILGELFNSDFRKRASRDLDLRW